jgi:hypothetical protein
MADASERAPSAEETGYALLFCRRFLLTASLEDRELDAHLFLYSKAFWNEFEVDKTLSIPEDLECNLAFVVVQEGC